MDWIKEYQLNHIKTSTSTNSASSNNNNIHNNSNNISNSNSNNTGGRSTPSNRTQSNQQHQNLSEQISEMSIEDESKVRRGGHRNAMKRKKKVEYRGHRFLLTYFKQPSFCSVCTGFIWGVHQRQAYQCSLCQLAAHEKCIQNCAADCRSMEKSKDTDSSNCDGNSNKSKERFNIDIPHSWKNKTFLKPTFCSHCGSMLYGLVRQGLQCRECDRIAHVRCAEQIANDCGLNALMLMRHLKQIEDTKKDQKGKDGGSSASHETAKNKSNEIVPSFDHLFSATDFEENSMSDCLLKSLALTRAPDRLRAGVLLFFMIYIIKNSVLYTFLNHFSPSPFL